jgi:uncharacterized protein (DUF2267 family)
METTENQKILKEAKDRAKLSEEYYKTNRDKALEDLEFLYNEDQWEQEVKTSRGRRPCLNSNDLPIFLDQLVGDQRMNRAGIKVHPVDNNSDPMKAEVIGGLIRNIEHLSDAHVAYDKALEFVAGGGYAGAIRVITQYETDDIFDEDGNIRLDIQGAEAKSAFNQEIRIVPVENPLNVLYDPNAKLWHKNDGDFMFYYDDMDVDVFKEKYPAARAHDFEGEVPTQLKGWFHEGDKTVRIAEYFRKEPKGSKTIYLVTNPEGELMVITEKPEDPTRIINEREIEDFDLYWYLLSGYEILDGPTKIPGKLFPIIPVWGKETNINGEQKIRGMFRYAKDPQRGYIYTQSAIVETVALAPKAPFVGTPKMFEGHENKWRTMNTDLHAYLPYNPDELAPGVMPQRTDPVQPPVGLIEQGATRQAEKRNVIGLQEASLGKRSNETSGLAIQERKAAGTSVTFTFIDNLNRAIRQTGRVIIGMIPTIYAEERILRIIGVDGKESLQQVNTPFENPDGTTGIIDLKVGKHDVIVMTGPSYGTQRIEFVDRLTQIMQYAPQIAPLVAPAVVEMMDIPHSEKIVKILEATLPPQVQAAMGDQPSPTPEQIQQAIQQAAMQAVEEYKGSVEAQQEQLKTQQQSLKVEQERLQTEQERIQLEKEKVQLIKEANKPVTGDKKND